MNLRYALQQLRKAPGITREQAHQDVLHIADVFQQNYPDTYSPSVLPI
jgi:hypothetical protein